jgi:hypothetical protein
LQVKNSNYLKTRAPSLVFQNRWFLEDLFVIKKMMLEWGSRKVSFLLVLEPLFLPKSRKKTGGCKGALQSCPIETPRYGYVYAKPLKTVKRGIALFSKPELRAWYSKYFDLGFPGEVFFYSRHL